LKESGTMMPVPSHLVGCVVPKDASIDEKPLDADVRCPCGSDRFELLFPGQTHEYEGEPIPCTAKIDGHFYFRIIVRCTHCELGHLLLDTDFHGWNGFVCHDPEQAARPRPALIPWKCLKCGTTEHKASVHVQTEGKADFISESGGKFDEDRWPDGFGWFGVATVCTFCGKNTPEWVSCETM
jgi:hypothetical protein